MIERTTRRVRDFYNLFTSGLTVQEIERLVNVETRDTYAYYLRHVKPEKQQQGSIKRFVLLCWNLFLAFLLKLTPARRLFYAVAIFGLGYAFYRGELAYALYSFLIMNFLLALEVADKLITKDELGLAREIQLGLLPNHLSPPAGYDVAAYSEVASNVGGDYYDLIPLADGSTLLVIGDVSGKGISAALYMVKVQTALQLLAKDSTDPRELLVRLNRHLYGQLKKNYFLTISLLQVFPHGGMRLCRAGHTPALFCAGNTRLCTPLQPGGAALGLTPSGADNLDANLGWKTASKENGNQLYEQLIETYSSVLQEGDIVFLYTDGVVETVDGAGQEFGEQRLKDLISGNAHASAENLKSTLVQELTSFRAGAELRDDTTFVVLKRR